MPPVADRPDADLHHRSVYSSQSDHVRSEVRSRAAEREGAVARRRARWVQTVAEGAGLFVVVDFLMFGWRPFLILLGLLAGAAVGQVWHTLRPSDSVCACIGGAAFVACAFAAGGGSVYMMVAATMVVAGLSAFMARQRVREAFGA